MLHTMGLLTEELQKLREVHKCVQELENTGCHRQNVAFAVISFK
jgi:hypothetical protein